MYVVTEKKIRPTRCRPGVKGDRNRSEGTIKDSCDGRMTVSPPRSRNQKGQYPFRIRAECKCALGCALCQDQARSPANGNRS